MIDIIIRYYLSFHLLCNIVIVILMDIVFNYYYYINHITIHYLYDFMLFIAKCIFTEPEYERILRIDKSEVLLLMLTVMNALCVFVCVGMIMLYIKIK